MKTENNSQSYYEEADYPEGAELLPDKMGIVEWVIVAFAVILIFTFTRAAVIFEDAKYTTARFFFRVSLLVIMGGLTIEYYAHHVHTPSYVLPALLFAVVCFYLYGVIHFITDPIIDLIFLPRQTISEIEKNNRN